MTAPLLESALENVRTEVAIVDDQLRFGFISDNERLWFPVRVIDTEQHENVTIKHAELNVGTRLRRPSGDERITLLDNEAFLEIFRDMLSWLTPMGPYEGLVLVLQRNELVAWRDSSGDLHLQSWQKMPANVSINRKIKDGELAGHLLSLMEVYQDDAPAVDMEKVVFTLTPEQPGAPGWLYLNVADQSLYYVLSPFGGSELTEPRLRVSLKTLDRVILRSHFLTFIKNPFTTIWRFMGHGADAIASLARRPGQTANPDAPLNKGPGMDIDTWERRLDLLTRTRRYPGSLKFLLGGEEYFTDLIASIHAAEKYVDIRTYIFDNDEYATGFADLLKNRSEHLRVRVMMDDLGSLLAGLKPPPQGYRSDYEPPTDMVRYLEQGADVQARRSGNPWLTGDHVKLKVIDREIAYLGGMNIGEEYRSHWHDMMVRVEGSIVWGLQ